MVCGSWGDSEASGWKCQTCWESIEDYWLPEDFYNYAIDVKTAVLGVPLMNTKALEAGMKFFADGSWTTCIICAGPCKGECWWDDHEYTPYEDVVEVDVIANTFSYINPNSSVILPIENFYRLDHHDATQHMPLDCRSCEFYQTSKCVPLRNAIDDLDNIIGNIKDPYLKQSEYQIVPCHNWAFDKDSAFESQEAVREFISAFKIYYGLNIRKLISIGDIVRDWHYSEVRFRPEVYELLKT